MSEIKKWRRKIQVVKGRGERLKGGVVVVTLKFWFLVYNPYFCGNGTTNFERDLIDQLEGEEL